MSWEMKVRRAGKEYRVFDDSVDGDPGRIVGVGLREAVYEWCEQVGLQVLQYTDYDDYESALAGRRSISDAPPTSASSRSTGRA
jgi:hypothetical protein